MAAATIRKSKPKSRAATRAKTKPRPTSARAPQPAAAADRAAPALAEVDTEVLEFIEAIDRFKKQHGRPFPSWSEVLLVVRELGYRKGS